MLNQKMKAAFLVACVVSMAAPAAYSHADVGRAAALDQSASGSLSLLPGPLPPGDDDSGPVINPPGPKPPPR